jgi:hypothetical protein
MSYPLLRGRRLLVSVAIASLTAAVVWVGQSPPAALSDFTYIDAGARALIAGQNPYTQTALPFPLYYPLPALLLTLPFALLPFQASMSAFVGVGVGCLAWAWSRTPWRLWGLVSAPLVHAVLLGQWSPWLTAGIAVPWIAGAWVAKPSVGLAYLVAWPRREAVIGGAVLLTLSLVVAPAWPRDWLANLHRTPQYVAPIFRPWGWLLLFAWLRWRRSEARLLGMLAFIPHTVAFHEMLPLLLIAQRPRALAVLMGLGYVGAALMVTHVPMSSTMVARMLNAQWPYLLAFGYLPALVLVLWRDRAQPPPLVGVSLAVDRVSESRT